MAGTFTELLYHCVWSTKFREPLIRSEIEENVWRILAGTAEKNGMQTIRVGGIENHVHVLLRIPKTLSVSEALKRLKGGSSAFIHQEGLMKSTTFGWQDGYAAFTVSTSNVPDVIQYIANQREHHRKQTFEEEYEALLKRHKTAYESKYLWD
jgi:REP element-mobilizing transposase RayT